MSSRQVSHYTRRLLWSLTPTISEQVKVWRVTPNHPRMPPHNASNGQQHEQNFNNDKQTDMTSKQTLVIEKHYTGGICMSRPNPNPRTTGGAFNPELEACDGAGAPARNNIIKEEQIEMVDKNDAPQGSPIAIAYVPNNGSDTVSVVNIFNDGTAQKLPVDIPVGKGPFAAAITPDGSFAYISNNGDATVSVIDTTVNEVVSTINLNAGSFFAEGPEGLKVTPDGSFVYVVNFGTSSVSIIDTSINQVVKDFDLLFQSVAFIDFNPDGTQAYLTAPLSNQVIVVNLAVNLPVKTIENIGDRPEGIFISKDPDVPIALAASQRADALTPIDTLLASTDRFLIDSSGKRPTGVNIVILQNREIGLVPAAYVTNRDSNNVAVINLFLNPETVTPTPIKVGNAPQGIDSTLDGKFVAVANSGDGTVSVINTDTNKVTATVKVGLTPLWLAVLDKRRPPVVGIRKAS